MYWRYEGKEKDEDEYDGIFAFLNLEERMYFSRFVKPPKWYKNNPDIDTRCWFTEYGYEKYHHIIEDMILGRNGWEGHKDLFDVRLVGKKVLDNIVCKDKVQCIELL